MKRQKIQQVRELATKKGAELSEYPNEIQTLMRRYSINPAELSAWQKDHCMVCPIFLQPVYIKMSNAITDKTGIKNPLNLVLHQDKNENEKLIKKHLNYETTKN